MSAATDFDILLVDDEPTVIRVLSMILSDFAPLRFATSGHTALKLARQSIPDLVLLDIDMPDFSGFDVCKAFKSDSALANVPIIFISSHDSPQLEAKGLELGAADFIRKPPNAALVQTRVRTYKQMKSLSDTLRSGVTMDFLTGAVTRRKLEKTLAQEWLRAQQSGASIALILTDITGFSDYNAAYGEEQGDACLRSVAEALRSVLRQPTDMLGRYAGGQFALLLPDTSADGAVTVAARAASAIKKLNLTGATANGAAAVSLSFGIGHHAFATPSAGQDHAIGSMRKSAILISDDLLAAARQALQRARADNQQQPVMVVV